MSNHGSGKGGNRRWADDAWRRDLAVCAKCGAGVREQCRTPMGRPSKPHRGRESIDDRPKPRTMPRWGGGVL